MNVARFLKFAITSAPKPQIYQKMRLDSRILSRPSLLSSHIRNVSTVETKQLRKHESFVYKIVNKLPFINLNKTRIMGSAYVLYENIADKINYLDFFEELHLPDTFYSWFVVTELHIWMISARAMADGDDGKFLRNYLVEALWNDVNQRIKHLGEDSNPSAARVQVRELAEQLQAALIAYDEGLQGDDVVLAGALWRRFYQQEDVDPKSLEVLVKYVRKQMRLLDHVSLEQFFEERRIDWICLKN
jgi:cytochrome b pre-mRNA-processing protein 3